MTAPAAPRIYVAQWGGMIRLRWAEVETATDYNVYMGDTTAPTGLEDSVADDEMEPDGWFVWWSTEQAGPIFVRVTALNALAEESAYSNEAFRYITSNQDGQQVPASEDQALNHERKT